MSALAGFAIFPWQLIEGRWLLRYRCNAGGLQLLASGPQDPRTFSCSTDQQKPHPSSSSANFKAPNSYIKSTCLTNILTTLRFVQLILAEADALIQKARAEAKSSEKKPAFLKPYMQHIHYVTYPWKYLLGKYYVADRVELANSF